MWIKRCLPERIVIFAILLCFSSGLLSCGDEKLPPGVVATVNGEPITLHSVQNLLDSRNAGLVWQPDTSFEQIRANYGNALAMLIATTLVRQELEERGIEPTEHDLNQAIERISSDYGDGDLEEFLAEASLRPEDWKALMRDHLALEVFRNQILLPTIKIEFQDIKTYYQEHEKDFILPETTLACFLASLDRSEIQDWCASISRQNLMEDGIAQCVEVPAAEIPPPWSKEVKSLKPMSCGKIHEVDGEWQSVALLERRPERLPELSEVLPLVEKILLEPRQAAAFEQWLAQKSAASRVLVAPGLLDVMKGAGAPLQETKKSGN